MYYKSYYFCLRSCKSHPQENEKFMSTVGQFSRTDSLPFKDGSFICILDLIDLVMQIQRFQKGWTLNPNVSHHKQGKMFPFSSLVIKVWRAKPKYSHLVFFSIFGFDHANHTREKFTKTRSRSSRTDSLPFKERNLGCTAVDLVMKIKPFKEVNT